MTRLHNTSIGKFDQLKRHLAGAGLTGEDVDAVLRQPELATKMVRALRSSIPPAWYVCAEDQLANVRRWNDEYNWGFTNADFPKVIPDFVPKSSLEVRVLAVYLPDSRDNHGYVLTAQALWNIARNQQISWRESERDLLGLLSIQLLNTAESAHIPGIRWVALDLGAYWRIGGIPISPDSVKGKNSLHAEVFAAAAHFPGWIQSMGNGEIPYVWIAGYKVSSHIVAGVESWDVLGIRWHEPDGAVHLLRALKETRNPDYAIPGIIPL